VYVEYMWASARIDVRTINCEDLYVAGSPPLQSANMHTKPQPQDESPLRNGDETARQRVDAAANSGTSVHRPEPDFALYDATAQPSPTHLVVQSPSLLSHRAEVSASFKLFDETRYHLTTPFLSTTNNHRSNVKNSGSRVDSDEADTVILSLVWCRC
jgi:hypothetical protein